MALAPDARKRDNLEAPVAPRHDGIQLFASPALLTQDNLDLLMAMKSQRHEEAVHNVCKGCKKWNQNKKTQTFPDVAFKLDLGCLLN